MGALPTTDERGLIPRPRGQGALKPPWQPGQQGPGGQTIGANPLLPSAAFRRLCDVKGNGAPRYLLADLRRVGADANAHPMLRACAHVVADAAAGEKGHRAALSHVSDRLEGKPITRAVADIRDDRTVAELQARLAALISAHPEVIDAVAALPAVRAALVADPPSIETGTAGSSVPNVVASVSNVPAS